MGAMIIALRRMTRELIQVFSTENLNKNTTYVSSMIYLTLCGVLLPLDRLGFETDREPGRLKQRGETQHGLRMRQHKRGKPVQYSHGEAMKKTSPNSLS